MIKQTYFLRRFAQLRYSSKYICWPFVNHTNKYMYNINKLNAVKANINQSIFDYIDWQTVIYFVYSWWYYDIGWHSASCARKCYRKHMCTACALVYMQVSMCIAYVLRKASATNSQLHAFNVVQYLNKINFVYVLTMCSMFLYIYIYVAIQCKEHPTLVAPLDKLSIV